MELNLTESSETIYLGDKLSVFKDKKTGVSSIAIPFDFLSGKKGFLSITKLDKFDWNPSDDIESITINHKLNDHKTP